MSNPRSLSVHKKAATRNKRPSQGELNARRFKGFLKSWETLLVKKAVTACAADSNTCTLTGDAITAAQTKAARKIAADVPAPFIKVSAGKRQQRQESLIKSFDDYVKTGTGFQGKSVVDTMAEEVARLANLKLAKLKRSIAIEPVKIEGGESTPPPPPPTIAPSPTATPTPVNPNTNSNTAYATPFNNLTGAKDVPFKSIIDGYGKIQPSYAGLSGSEKLTFADDLYRKAFGFCEDKKIQEPCASFIKATTGPALPPMASDSVQAKRADLLNKAFADAFVMDGNYNIVVKQ